MGTNCKATVRFHARHWQLMRLAMFGLLLRTVAATAFAAAPSAPTSLRVNDAVEPVGTEATPYFGWIVNDADANEIQTHYQILVATSTANLDANLGDAWDSGVVVSGKTRSGVCGRAARRRHKIFLEGPHLG